MRVTLVTRIYEPEPAAAAFRLAALVRALGDGGDEVLVLTTRAPLGAEAADAPDGTRIRRAPVLRDSGGNVRGYLQYLSFDVPAFFRLLFSRRSDVVVVEPPPTSGFLSRVACAIRRIPYVYYAADVWSAGAESIGAPGFVLSLLRWVERRALRGAATVIAVTDGVAEKVRLLAPAARVEVVPNGIDTEVFTPDGETIADAPWGVYAGTTSEWQGADVFIRAMPRVRETLPDARIVFVGQGSAWPALRELAAKTGGAGVSFVDPVPAQRAAALLRSARAGLVSLKPGQGYDFALPTKVLASAACGTPVVFAGVGTGAEFVRTERLGAAVDHDPESVAHAMIEAFRSPPSAGRRGELGAWARDRVSSAARASTAADVVRAAARGRHD